MTIDRDKDNVTKYFVSLLQWAHGQQQLYLQHCSCLNNNCHLLFCKVLAGLVICDLTVALAVEEEAGFFLANLLQSDLCPSEGLLVGVVPCRGSVLLLWLGPLLHVAKIRFCLGYGLFCEQGLHVERTRP